MTRVFCMCLLVFALSASASKVSIGSNPFNEALSLLENYSPYTSNLTNIQYLLELSAQEDNYEAMVKLGEFWLLGYPVAYENPNNHSHILKDGIFNRNIDLAMYYFKKALSKSKEAGHYISIVLQQSFLVDSFAKYTPVSGVQIATIKSLEEASIKKMSSMAIASSIFHYEKCLSHPKVPNYLKGDSFSYINFPYSHQSTCDYDCEKLGYLAIIPATSALEYIQRLQRVRTPMRAIGEDVGIYGDNMKNLLKLYGKSIGNHPQSMTTLGDFYIKGNLLQGVEREISTGLSLLEKAASAGDMHAHEHLGTLYYKGSGVEKNLTKAFEHLNTAKKQGSLVAHALIGEMFLHGHGVPEDKSSGLTLLKYASQNGNLEANIILGCYYFLEKEWEKAAPYLEVGAQFEDPQSMYYLGIMILQGLGVRKDCNTALYYLKKVIFMGELGEYAEKGFSMYMMGDIEGAFLYNLVSASFGVENSLLSLGYLYENNLVPERFRCSKGNEYCAGVYYSLAYQSSMAMNKLGNLIAKGNEHYLGNYTDALYYYQRSSYLPESLFAIAMMNEYGLGMEENLTRSVEMYNDIVDKAEKGIVDKDAKYPALLAIAIVKAKSNPIIQDLTAFAHTAYELIEQVFNSVNFL